MEYPPKYVERLQAVVEELGDLLRQTPRYSQATRDDGAAEQARAALNLALEGLTITLDIAATAQERQAQR